MSTHPANLPPPLGPGLPGGQSPVWLLDVDGVLNVSRPGWHAPPRHANAYVDGTAFRLRWAPAAGQGLLIAPRLRAGLQPEHLEAIEAFLATTPIPPGE